MRKLSFVAVLTALAFSSAVSASTVTFLWVGSSQPVAGIGTSTADVSGAVGPVTLTLDVVVGADANGVSSFGLDIEFDTDGDNELDLLSYAEITWQNAKATRNLVPIAPGLNSTQESQTGGPEGQAFGFDLFTLGSGPNNITLTFARVVFVTDPTRASTAAYDPGDDIFSTNERDPSASAAFSNAGAPIPFQAGARVIGLNPVPEPGTIGLLGLGLASLAVASRRRS